MVIIMKKLFGSLVIGVLLTGCVVNYDPDKNNIEEVVVTYKVLEEVVNTQKIVKGEKLGTIYTYESSNHQSYVSEWSNGGVIFDENTVVNGDITLTGSPKSSLQIFNTPENEYVYVNGVNHVHSDGKVVVLSTYYGKPVNIGLHAFSNNGEMRELYLPSNLHRIYSDNFVNCSNLTTIYFGGSEEEWTAIPTDSVIPSSINLVFNTSFTF